MAPSKNTRKPRSNNVEEMLDEETIRYQTELEKLGKQDLVVYACDESIDFKKKWNKSEIRVPLVTQFKLYDTKMRSKMEKRLVERIRRSNMKAKKSRQSQTLDVSDLSELRIERIERLKMTIYNIFEEAMEDIMSNVANIV